MTKDFSREYGTALYSLAVEENVSGQIFDELSEVCGIYSKSPEFMRLLNNPRLPAGERARAVGEVFDGRCSAYLANFLKILAEKRRSDILPKCFEVYKKLYCDDNGILPVKVTSASALSDEQRKRLKKVLSEKTGRDVMLTEMTDPNCIGGLKVEYSGKLFDSSVRGKLSGLLNELNSL